MRTSGVNEGNFSLKLCRVHALFRSLLRSKEGHLISLKSSLPQLQVQDSHLPPLPQGPPCFPPHPCSFIFIKPSTLNFPFLFLSPNLSSFLYFSSCWCFIFLRKNAPKRVEERGKHPIIGCFLPSNDERADLDRVSVTSPAANFRLWPN